MEREDQSVGIEEKAREAAALWRSVVSRPPHPAGCTCMGHFLVPAMDPVDMEADIIGFMRRRYALEHLDPLVALLDARVAARPAAAPHSFRIWLTQLPASPVDPRLIARFLNDLIATLESFGAGGRTPSSPSRLICT